MIAVVQLEAPAGSVLVRVPVRAADSWARQLPMLPEGITVTVTVASSDVAATPGDDLVGSGYRLAGVLASIPAGCVDLLVTPEVRGAAGGWWRELAGRADRVFDLRMGPVRRIFADAVSAHLRAV